MSSAVTCYRLYVGIGSREVPPSALPELAAIADAYGGFTVTTGYGGWTDDHGQLICEPCLVIEVADACNVGRAPIVAAAASVAARLGQDCTMLVPLTVPAPGVAFIPPVRGVPQ